jgi:hypothetical protein
MSEDIQGQIQRRYEPIRAQLGWSIDFDIACYKVIKAGTNRRKNVVDDGW